MIDPERHAAANDAIAAVARKWLGVRQVPRDRDVPEAARHAVRITAFLHGRDGRWKRGELVVPQPADYVVWQPFPQGEPFVFAGPVRLIDRAQGGTAAHDVREIQLVGLGDQLALRVTELDLKVLSERLR